MHTYTIIVFVSEANFLNCDKELQEDNGVQMVKSFNLQFINWQSLNTRGNQI